ncbi:hypothetical protein ACFL4G_08890 [Thermodesulfobacteriota bacterium]
MHGKTVRYILFSIVVIAGSVYFITRLPLFKFMNGLSEDTANIGVMAINILQKGENPLFMYGGYFQSGGASIEAHVAALIFHFTDPSPYALNLVALIFSALTLVAAAVFVGMNYGNRASVFCTILCLFPPPFFAIWGLKIRGGNVIEPFLSVLFFIFLFRSMRVQVVHRRIQIFITGLIAGIAFWNHPSSLIITGPLLMAMIFLHGSLRSGLSTLIFVMLAFFIGAAPIILLTIQGGNIYFEQLSTFIFVGGERSIAEIPGRLYIFLADAMPYLFSYKYSPNVDYQNIGFSYNPLEDVRFSISTVLIIFLFIFSTASLFIQEARNISKGFQRQRDDKLKSLRNITVLLIPLWYSLVLTIIAPNISETDHLVPIYYYFQIYPFFLIPISVWAAIKRSKLKNIVVITSLLVLCVSSALSTYQLTRSSPSGEERFNLITNFLKEKGIKHVYCNFQERFSLRFYSQGTLITSPIWTFIKDYFGDEGGEYILQVYGVFEGLDISRWDQYPLDTEAVRGAFERREPIAFLVESDWVKERTRSISEGLIEERVGCYRILYRGSPEAGSSSSTIE